MDMRETFHSDLNTSGCISTQDEYAEPLIHVENVTYTSKNQQHELQDSNVQVHTNKQGNQTANHIMMTSKHGNQVNHHLTADSAIVYQPVNQGICIAGPGNLHVQSPSDHQVFLNIKLNFLNVSNV